MLDFTKEEKVIVVFLSIAILIGAGVRSYKRHSSITYPTHVEIKKETQARKIVNINTAGKRDLLVLNGIGPTLARRIISYRKEYGSFDSKEDIMNVKGIGPHKFNKIKDFIVIKDSE